MSLAADLIAEFCTEATHPAVIAWYETLAAIIDANDSSGEGGGISDGNKGDITVGSSGTSWSLNNSAVTNAKMANMIAGTIKGRISTTGSPQDLSASDIRSIITDASNRFITDALLSKLSGIEAGATENLADAVLLNRANHLGTQLASTISDFAAAVDARLVGIGGLSEAQVRRTSALLTT